MSKDQSRSCITSSVSSHWTTILILNSSKTSQLRSIQDTRGSLTWSRSILIRWHHQQSNAKSPPNSKITMIDSSRPRSSWHMQIATTMTSQLSDPTITCLATTSTTVNECTKTNSKFSLMTWCPSSSQTRAKLGSNSVGEKAAKINYCTGRLKCHAISCLRI